MGYTHYYNHIANKTKKKSEYPGFVTDTYAVIINLVWIMLSNYTENALRLIFDSVNIKCS